MHASSKFVPNTYKHCLASRQRKRMDSENSESCNSIHRLVTLPPDFVVENTHKSRIKLAYRKRKEERTRERFDVRRDPWDYFIVSFLFRTLQEQYRDFGLLDLDYLREVQVCFTAIFLAIFPLFILSLFQKVSSSEVGNIFYCTIFRTEKPLRLKEEKEKALKINTKNFNRRWNNHLTGKMFSSRNNSL